MGDPKRRDVQEQRVDLASLRARVRAIERRGGAAEQVPRFTFGLEALDAHLGGGLARGRVHEILGESRSELRDAGCFGFTAALLVRLLSASGAAQGGEILWCVREANMFGGALHSWGLKALGLDPDRIVCVAARDESERLWAAEEGLRCCGLGAVVAELGTSHAGEAGRVAERRLQLAAEAGGVTGFLLRNGADSVLAAAAESRWRVTAWPAGKDVRPHWSVALERLRSGQPGSWRLLWDPVAGRFLEAPDRSAESGIPIPEVKPTLRKNAAA